MPLICIDLFSGCGGLSLGLHQAAAKTRTKLETVAAVDSWQEACDTIAHNLPVIPRVAKIDRPLLEELASQFPDVDILTGGPPCQGFSSVGKRVLDDPRNLLVRTYVDAVEILRPRAFIMENVNGFVTMQDGKIFTEVVQSMRGLGYQVSAGMLLASAYGVPQHRRRCIIVGIRNDQDGSFSFPIGSANRVKPRHRGLQVDIQAAHLPKGRQTTFAQATGDLPVVASGQTSNTYKKSPTNEYQRKMRRGSKTLTEHKGPNHDSKLLGLMQYIPQGKSALHPDVLKKIPKKYRPTSGYGNSYGRIRAAAPAPTITRNFGHPSSANCIHPTSDRGLTIREAARCQSFPDTYHFKGTHGDRCLQIGNAVPPLMAEALGVAVIQTIGGRGTNAPTQAPGTVTAVCEKAKTHE